MKKFLRSFSLCLLLVGVLACQSKIVSPTNTLAQKPQGKQQHIIKNLSAELLIQKMRKKNDIILVDVREESEYMEGHIEGAKLIPWMQLRTRYKELDANKEIILYCHGGTRSKLASSVLIFNGFQRVSQMGGGLLEWQAKKYPLVKEGLAADAF